MFFTYSISYKYELEEDDFYAHVNTKKMLQQTKVLYTWYT
jgi:hypothetical protein